jgi:hypothetical protein
VDVDTFSVETKPGDLFLLCSDGLSSMVDDETILDMVERNRGDLGAAAKALVRAANRGGGDDNITVVFFEIADVEDTEKTMTLPPVEVDDDETLDELDRVPAIVAEDGRRPRPERRRGRGAVYQGVPWNIVGNVRLYRPVYVSPLLAAQLSQRERQKLFDHKLRSDESARAVVRHYEEQIGAR